MTIFENHIDNLTETDLQRLIQVGSEESKTLDFKSTLPDANDKGKVDFCVDVVAMANTLGGDIIFGMEEQEGVAARLCSIPLLGIDREIIRLGDTLTSRVQPRIHGLQWKVIPLASGDVSLVLHVPRSLNGPHAVVNGENLRFVARGARNNYTLDVGAVRAAILRSVEVADRIRAFRADRLAKLIAGDLPTPLKNANGPKLVLHIVPFSIDTGVYFPVLAAEQNTPVYVDVAPPGGGGYSFRINFDGMLKYNEDAYVQLYHNGCVEAVHTRLLSGDGYKRQIPSTAYEHYTVVALRNYLAFLRQLSVEPPFTVMLTLLGVAGYTLGVPQNYTMPDQDPIDRDMLLVPEVVVESYERNAPDILRSAFDAVWNAAGWRRSHNYDESGKWLAPMGQ